MSAEQLTVQSAETGVTVQDHFAPFFAQTEEWKSKAFALVITDVGQTAEMKMAREARLAIKNIRVNVEKTRKELKEESLRRGQAIDEVAKTLNRMIEPIESHLTAQEKFAENLEAERKAKLKTDREAILAPYEVETGFYDLANMPDETFGTLLESSKMAFEKKIEAARIAEEERIAKEKADAEERERERLENIRLKAEAEERERELAAERKAAEDARIAAEKEANRIREEQEKILADEREQARKEREAAEAEARRIQAEQDAKLKAEREERERIERELQEKRDAEIRAQKEAADKAEKERLDKIEAERKAAAAPDKNKLLQLAATIRETAMPELNIPEAQAVLANVKGLLAKVDAYIKEKAETL